MDLFKALKEKKYSELTDHCVEKISDYVASKIDNARKTYLNKVRGIDEDTTIVIKKDSDDEDDHEKAKETDKDGEGDSDDHEEAKDSDDGDKKKDKKPKFMTREAKEETEDDSEEDEKVVVKKDFKKTPKTAKKGFTEKDAKKIGYVNS